MSALFLRRPLDTILDYYPLSCVRQHPLPNTDAPNWKALCYECGQTLQLSAKPDDPTATCLLCECNLAGEHSKTLAAFGLNPQDVESAVRPPESAVMPPLPKAPDMPAAIQLYGVGDFLTAIGSPPPMLIQGLLPEKSLILLSGKPKHGKSFLALDIADAVSQGNDVLECYTVNRPGRTVYFSMEDSPFTLANRLLARGVRPGDTRPLTVCTARFQIGTPEGMAAFRQLVTPLQPVLIIIDTAAEALGIKDWANRSEIVEKMGLLRDLARDLCTILLVSHNRKAAGEYGDEIAGSNAFTGAVDGWLSSTSKKEAQGGNMRVDYKLDGRDIRGEFTVEMDSKTFQFRALTPDEMIEADKLTEAETQAKQQLQKYQKVARALAHYDGKATAKQLYEHLEMSQSTFSRLQKDMQADKHIAECGTDETTAAKGPRSVLLTIPESSELYSFMRDAKTLRMNEYNSEPDEDESDEADPFADEDDE